MLLVFYPLAFTGTCQGELCSVRDNLDDFVNDTTQVLTGQRRLAVQPQGLGRARRATTFPLLADFWPHGARGPGVRRLQRASAASPTAAPSSSTRAGIVRFAEMNGPGQARDQDAWRKALAAL